MMTPRFFNFGAGPTPTGTRRPPAARASPFGIVWSLRWHPYLVLSSGASVVRSTPLVCDRFGGCYLYDIKAGKTTWRGDDVRDEDWCDKQGRKSQYVSVHKSNVAFSRHRRLFDGVAVRFLTARCGQHGRVVVEA